MFGEVGAFDDPVGAFVDDLVVAVCAFDDAVGASVDDVVLVCAFVDAVGAFDDAVDAFVDDLVLVCAFDGAVDAFDDDLVVAVCAFDAFVDDRVVAAGAVCAFDGALGRLGGVHVHVQHALFVVLHAQTGHLVGDESGAFVEGPCLLDAYLSRRAPRTLVRQALEPTFWNLTLS